MKSLNEINVLDGRLWRFPFSCFSFFRKLCGLRLTFDFWVSLRLSENFSKFVKFTFKFFLGKGQDQNPAYFGHPPRIFKHFEIKPIQKSSRQTLDHKYLLMNRLGKSFKTSSWLFVWHFIFLLYFIVWNNFSQGS